MFAIGGENATSGFLASVERYDVASNTWAEMQPMPIATSQHAVCAVGDYLYVIGGLVAGDEASASVFTYDVSSNSWTEAANMPAARCQMCVCVIGTHIHCIGGADEEHVTVALV